MITDEWIEAQVTEFCSYLEGHREALREIANAALEKGKRDERERILKLLDDMFEQRAFLEYHTLFDNFRQSLKGE